MKLDQIKVVDLHHEVLPFFAQASRQAGTALPVITFDHHTDTLPPFGRLEPERQSFWRYKLTQLPWSAETLHLALQELRHDEHFALGLQIGIISHVYMFASTATDILPPGITLLPDPDIAHCEIIPPGSDPVWRSWCDRALESDFLRSLLHGVALPERDYILDIDLDYFKSPGALTPKNGEFFRQLVANCRLLTISREAQWVKLLGCERNWSADRALEALLKLIDD